MINVTLAQVEDGYLKTHDENWTDWLVKPTMDPNLPSNLDEIREKSITFVDIMRII